MVFLAACLAIFMVSVEATIVATAIPTIVGDLGGLRLFSWVFGIYFLTQAVGIPVYGRLADIYGRKNLMIVAVILFLAGSILSGFAHNMLMLIVYRGLQGLGGGGVQPLASTIVGDLYTGKERARVQGYMSSTWGISAVAGPLLGAFIVQHVGWPAIFWSTCRSAFSASSSSRVFLTSASSGKRTASTTRVPCCSPPASAR